MSDIISSIRSYSQQIKADLEDGDKKTTELLESVINSGGI